MSAADAVRVGLIAAVGRDGVVGRDGGLPWHLPEDLRHFKRMTRGHVVVLGRRTWEEIGRPLPGRPHVVVSSSLQEPPHPDVRLARDLDEAIRLGRAIEAEAVEAGRIEAGIVWLIGGPRIWAEGWSRVDEAWLTEVDAAPPGDTYFPAVDFGDFTREVVRVEAGPPAQTYVCWRRKSP